MTKTTTAYEKAVISMCQEFVDKYTEKGDEPERVTKTAFVGQQIGDVIVVQDMYLDVVDIKKALEADMSYDELTNWYYDSIGLKENETYINLRSWLMGARRNHTQKKEE